MQRGLREAPTEPRTALLHPKCILLAQDGPIVVAAVLEGQMKLQE